MIKRTLCFTNPAYLSLSNSQLVVKIPEVEKTSESASLTHEAVRTIPIEDIGVVILDNMQITITHGSIAGLLDNNCAIITCNDKHLPVGLLLPLDGNSTQSERFRDQLDATQPLKKQLWQQTVRAKIENQAANLKTTRGEVVKNMLVWANDVKSGDPDNYEARAAAYYWKLLFPQVEKFTRDRGGEAPNSLLNYGYAILRAVIARALVGSGLLPTLGIHHHNRYNAYCLADDIMEPYRPFVDKLVVEIVDSCGVGVDLTTEVKKRLLAIPVVDVVINGERSPLMIAAGITSASVYKCFSGEVRKIAYPTLT